MEHERYTELVVLAAGGQLSGEEYDVLKAHVEVCASCRREFAEYQDMIFKQFPLAGSEWTEGAVGPQVTEAARDYKNRFMARAKAEGIPLSVEEKASNRTFWTILGAKLAWSPAYAYGTVLVLSLFSAFVAYRLHEARTMELTQSREKQDLQDQIAGLRVQNSDLDKQVSELSKTNGQAAEARAQLSAAKSQYAGLEARYAALEAEVKSSALRAEALQAEIQGSASREQGLSAKLEDTKVSLASVSNELQNLRKSRSVEIASTSDQVSRMKELEAQLGDANDYLDRAKKLLAADHDIRDLMGARTLHITDVYDVDSHGKTKSPFGRVFYTEGKSLIFYAFDLGKTKHASFSERSYQLWGYQEASSLSTQSLGMLYQDDQKQSRWVLKFNDPSVLSAIDAVFVTAEPPGGSEKPTGAKLLYAYLNTKPNHP